MRSTSFFLPTLYPAIAVALVASFGLAVWSGERQAPWLAAPAAWLFLALAAAAFGYEFQRDRATAARVVLVLALLGAFIGGVASFVTGTSVWGKVLGCVVAALPALAVLVLIVRMQRGAEEYPNLLRQRFGSRAGEERGVRLGVDHPPSLRTGEVGHLQACVQNTWDAPRSITLDVGGTGAWRARYRARTELSLGPLEVAMVTIPVAVDESEVPRIRLAVELSVHGRGGRRRRFWRAPLEVHRRRLPRDVDLAEAQFGRPGGLVVEVPVVGAATEPVPLPEPETRILWSPGGEAAPPLVR